MNDFWLKSFINQFIKSPFAKSVVLIAGGTASAQIINILFTPIVTRLYLPEEFGVLSIFVAIVGMLSTVSSLRYEWAIPIAKDKKEAINLLAGCIFILFITTLIIFVVLNLNIKIINNYFNSKKFNNCYNYIPLGSFAIGLYYILLQWSFRERNYKIIAKTKFYQAFFQNLFKILSGYLGIGIHGLLMGNIIGQSAGVTTLSKFSTLNIKDLYNNVSKENIIKCIKRYKNFPIFSATSQLFNSAGGNLPIIFMSAIYGSEMVGYFGLANSIVNVPMVLIGNSIGDVFYGETASIGKSNPHELKKLTGKLFKKLILIGLFPLVILILFGPQLFSVIFGTNWYEAGKYARILSLLVFARLIFTPISRLYSVFERQKESFLIDLFRVVLIIVVFVFVYFYGLSSYFAVLIYSLAMSVVYYITFYVAQKIINDEIKKY